ncbi:MAG: hypothetical protein A3C36_01720 [Omnitrophica WOR_2 bacterium RIFCSPHIGHO2_02_FULL_52_10]|nr:MAG: hypothetical protein A3C36_01720 [Omnitrophica WOR_2 bacterium RIFCSPHIGHO2_02_FULL_52_10]
MKKASKVFVMVLSLTVMMTVNTYAHYGMGEGDGDYVAKKVAKLTEQLSLSAEQAAQVEALIKEKMEKKNAIKEEKHAAIEAVKEEYSVKIKALLTDEQKAKYEEMQTEREKEEMKGSDHEHKDSGGEEKGS